MPGFETSHKVQRERECSPKKGPAGQGRGQMPRRAARAFQNWMATGARLAQLTYGIMLTAQDLGVQ